MTPRQMQKLIHDLGFTTNTAKIPGTDYYSVTVDLAEKEPRSSKFCIDTLAKITFSMQIYTTEKLSIQEFWTFPNLYQKVVHQGDTIVALLSMNTDNQVLTITIYQR